MAVGIKKREKADTSLPSRYYSTKQEKTVAAALGGVQTLNSGATDWQKSDVLTEQFTIECKTKMTQANSISIKKDWFEKQAQESVFMGKPYSAIVFNFGPDEENHYIINEELFEYLVHSLEKSK